MCNHTPGPWHFDKDNNGSHGYDHYNGVMMGNGQSVALVPHKTSSFAGRGDGLPWEANARLIAAAPDMYNALKLALKTILDEAEARDYDPPADTAVVALIESAIAKAEGRNDD